MSEIENKVEYLIVDEKSALYNEIIELRYKEFYEKFNRSKESIIDEFEKDGIKAAAKLNNRAVGFARLFINDNAGEISQVVVDENCRGMKIGAGVMRSLINIADEKGVKGLGLDARIAAIDFYKKLGFVVVSEVFQSKKTGMPHVRMERNKNKMEKEFINALDAALKYNLHLKVVTSVKTFDSYNSFFNIYDEAEEPCRRIAVLTKTKELEEVYDENNTEKINECKIIDGNLWIKDYSLLINPNKIDLSELMVDKKLVEELLWE